MRCSLTCLILAACHPATSTTSIDTPDGFSAKTEVHVLGAVKRVDSFWGATCEHSNGILTGDHKPSHSYRCNEKSIDVVVACSRACDVSHQIDGVGQAHADVTFLEIGPTNIQTTTTRQDNGENHRVTSAPIIVSMPERIELGCTSDHVLCGPDGIDASDPNVYPRLIVAGRIEESTLLKINGHSVPRYDLGVSLVQLYPDAKTERGIKPGDYDIELALGTAHAHWKIVAR